MPPPVWPSPRNNHSFEYVFICFQAPRRPPASPCLVAAACSLPLQATTTSRPRTPAPPPLSERPARRPLARTPTASRPSFPPPPRPPNRDGHFTPGKNKREPRGGVSALEGDLRKALGRSFLRWEKDNVKGTKASVCAAVYIDACFKRQKPGHLAPFPIADQ